MTSAFVKISFLTASLAALTVANAGIVLQDTFDTLDAAKWTVTNKTGTSATVVNQQLNLVYSGGTWGSGSSLLSSSRTFDGSPVEFTIQKISYTHFPSETDSNLYHNYVVGFASKAYLSYQHSKDKENLRLFVDGTVVFDSGAVAGESIVSNSSYLGFRLSATGWELIQSTDGITYTTRTSGARTINLNFSDQVKIANTNAHGYNNVMVLDNVTVSTVPEAASLGMLGLGAAGLLTRRR